MDITNSSSIDYLQALCAGDNEGWMGIGRMEGNIRVNMLPESTGGLPQAKELHGGSVHPPGNVLGYLPLAEPSLKEVPDHRGPWRAGGLWICVLCPHTPPGVSNSLGRGTQTYRDGSKVQDISCSLFAKKEKKYLR